MNLTKRLRTGFYNCFDLKKLDALAYQKKINDHPIVSLTTVPKRIQHLKPTLVSLLRQSILPKEIQINLGEDLFHDAVIPDFLNELKTIKLYGVKEDKGPATKYIPTLERFENTDQLIIIVDDDMYYASNLIECLMLADASANGEAAYCINGAKVPSNLESTSVASDKEIKSGMARVAIMEGCGGYTLRPTFVNLKELLETENAPSRSLYDDDIWMSGHLSRQNIRKYKIPTGRRKSLINTIESAITGDRAKLQTDLMRYFKLDWKPDEIG